MQLQLHCMEKINYSYNYSASKINYNATLSVNRNRLSTTTLFKTNRSSCTVTFRCIHSYVLPRLGSVEITITIVKYKAI